MPKYEPMPVNPQLISWARNRAGVSMEDAAQTWRAIEEWENGVGGPSYPQLEAMSEKFKVPVAVFFFPDEPDVPPISQSFRTIPEAEFDQLPGRIRLLCRRAKAYQISLAELNDGRNPIRSVVTRELKFRTNSSIPKMAETVRDFLGVSLEMQMSWRKTDEAMAGWRNVLQGAGISVFKDAFKSKEFSGFCLYDDEFPLIYVNNSKAKTRQIFTLFHELAHLFFDTSGIDGLDADLVNRLPAPSRRIEVLCNRFAAEFLLPEAVFEAEFAGMAATEETAALLGNRYHVSREFIYRRFLDRGLISQKTYNEDTKKWAEEGGGGGGTYYNNIIAYRGRDYINLAFSRYYQNRISNLQLADYLDVPTRNLNALEEVFLKGIKA